MTIQNLHNAVNRRGYSVRIDYDASLERMRIGLLYYKMGRMSTLFDILQFFDYAEAGRLKTAKLEPVKRLIGSKISINFWARGEGGGNASSVVWAVPTT